MARTSSRGPSAPCRFIGKDPAVAGASRANWCCWSLPACVGVLMHASVYGRYLYAIGHNESGGAVRGHPPDRYKIFAYVSCSVLAAGGGWAPWVRVETCRRRRGQLYELYAITGAVLGGCSLRGGEGLMFGAFLGTAVLPLLRRLTIFLGVSNEVQYAVFGLALLLGTLADEFFRRHHQDLNGTRMTRAARRRRIGQKSTTRPKSNSCLIKKLSSQSDPS